MCHAEEEEEAVEEEEREGKKTVCYQKSSIYLQYVLSVSVGLTTTYNFKTI